ncbi:MAG: DUF427 domain-containing protein [Chloroflexi bacterium]|nr:DUF427 domain-containing protein [Chloroflexota bacterium]
MVIAESRLAYRILETSHPPVYYIPQAAYWNLQVDGRESSLAAWSYPNPNYAYADIKDHLAFYASRVDEAYGGWITSNIIGPFKGGPGMMEW